MKVARISCCHMSWMPNTASSYRSDTTFKLCYVTSGHVLWEIEGESYDVYKGDIVLLDNSTLRRFTKIHGPTPLSMQIIMFSPDVLKNQNFLYMFYNTPLRKIRILQAKDVAGLETLLDLISDEAPRSSVYHFDIMYSLFNAAISLIAQYTKFEYAKLTKNYQKVRLALSFIDRYYTEPITLAQLASRAEMTPSSFSKAFLKCTGVGVAQYILRRRIEYAIDLLEHSDKNVLDIALECGFNNGAAFYQSFKKITGTVPKSFRK